MLPTARNRIARKMHTNTHRKMPLLPLIIESYFFDQLPSPPHLCVWGLTRASFFQYGLKYKASFLLFLHVKKMLSPWELQLPIRPASWYAGPPYTTTQHVINHITPSPHTLKTWEIAPRRPAPILPNKPFERKYSFPHMHTSFFLLFC